VNLENPFANREFIVYQFRNCPIRGGAVKDAYGILYRQMDRRWMLRGDRAWFKAEIHPTARNCVLVTCPILDYNLLHNFERVTHLHDRRDGRNTGNLQLSQPEIHGLKNAVRRIKDAMEQHLFGTYALIFPRGTNLTLEGVDMADEDRRERLLPFGGIEVVSPVALPIPGVGVDTYLKNDDYPKWVVLIGDDDGYRFDNQPQSRNSKMANVFGYNYNG